MKTNNIILNKIYNKIDYYLESELNFNYSDNIGLCILYANLYCETNNPCYYKIFEERFNIIVNISKFSNSGIIDGTASLLWLIKYLKRIDLISFHNHNISYLEKTVIQSFNASLNDNNWSYFYGGAIGSLIAIDKLKYYKLYLDFVLKKIKKNSNGNYEFFSSIYNTSTNLGLHLGILGVLAITNKLTKKGVYLKENCEIQNRIFDIIFSKLSETSYQFYPARYQEKEPCRMCWTYGELILGIQLLATGILTNNDDLKNEALKITEIATRRDTLESTIIIDSSLLCGSVGNFLLYKTLNNLYSTDIFKKSQNIWFNLTSQLLEEYDYLTIDRYTEKPKNDLSTLTGLSGICLCLDQRFNNKWLDYILLDVF